MNIAQIAKICHEVNRAWCDYIGDPTRVAWDYAPAWQRESVIACVKWRLEHPEAPVSAMHEQCLKRKETDGWTYGPVKDAEARQHPCIVPYGALPPDLQFKDELFITVARSCMP